MSATPPSPPSWLPSTPEWLPTTHDVRQLLPVARHSLAQRQGVLTRLGRRLGTDRYTVACMLRDIRKGHQKPQEYGVAIDDRALMLVKRSPSRWKVRNGISLVGLGKDSTGALAPFVEHEAKRAGAQHISTWTIHRGIAKKLWRSGYRPWPYPWLLSKRL